MASEFIAACPTLQAATVYVQNLERQWGYGGRIRETYHRHDGGLGLWRIATEDNVWDVWLRRRPCGTVEVYGEC